MTSCADVLAGRAPKETPVTLKGWVRTRRDSKAGFSFIHLSDGSSFHPVQVVAPKDLPNYEKEVLHLTAGCAIEATGTHRALARQGPALRDAGGVGQGRRLGGRPGFLSDPAQAAFARVPARSRAPAAAHQRDRRGDARAPYARAGDPPLLPRARLLLGQHADHHRRRCRGRRRAVPRVDARSGQLPAKRHGGVDFLERLLRPRNVS